MIAPAPARAAPARWPVRAWCTAAGVALLLLAATPGQAEDGPVPVVVAIASTMAPIEEVPLTGTAIARRVAALSPRVDGLVEVLHVDDGDFVRRGDVLMELDGDLAQIDVQRAAAALQEARARLADARRRRDETAELVRNRHVPRSEHAARIAEVEIESAALNRLEAEYRRQAELLDRHVVRAPFDGVVAAKHSEVGEWVDRGATVIELAEITVLRIEVPVPERYFAHVESGTPVLVRFDALPQAPVQARVSTRIAVGSAAARTFRVRIDVDNADRRLAPGMSARVVFRIGAGDGTRTLVVPRDAVVSKPDGTRVVWVVGDDDGVNVARPVEIRTGRNLGDEIEVIAGDLDPGDAVVVRGNEKLEPAQRLRIVAAP